MLIERGQADAIQLVRSTVNPAPGTTTTSEPLEANATNTSGVPPMVFVDDEGLEEQFLTEDKYSANVLDTSAKCVTTPVDTIPTNQGIQQAQNEELDLQPSRGPKEESIVNTIDQFLDDNYEDVLHTSNIQTNFSLSASDRNLTGCPVLPSGVFLPLQDPLSLPPPVQTPKQQENNSKNSQLSQNSWENVGKQNIVRRDDRENEMVTPAQGESHEF